jgi:hypothetical protein
MDPQATWRQLIESWTSHDWETVQESADSLLSWLGRNGVPPETIRGTRVGGEWNRVVVRAVCEYATELMERVLSDSNGVPAHVPFSLSCTDCDVPGPASFDEATNAGWTQIEFAPEAIAENFLGLCPRHTE